MSYSPGDSVVRRFIVVDLNDAPAAISSSAGSLVRNGVVDGTVTVTITNTGTTGDYTASFTIPSGYAVGDTVQLRVTGTVNGSSKTNYLGLGSLDAKVNTRSTLTAAGVWDYLASAATTAGSLGKRIADYLGGGSKVAATIATGDIADISAARAAKIDRLDENVSAAKTLTSAYDAAKTAASQLSVNQIPTNPLLTNDARLPAGTTAISTYAGGEVAGISGVTFPAGFSTLTVSNIQSGLSTLNAAGVRSALGLATANLDTQLSGLSTAIGEGGGLTAEDVWTYNGDRTLTEYPPSGTVAVPLPGVGIFAAGARGESQAQTLNAAAIEGQSLALLCRPLRVSGDYFTAATTTSVTSEVIDEQGVASTTTVTHTPADVILSSLTTDARWTEDAIGFNVDVPIAGTRIARAGTTYRITLTLVDTAGQIAKQRWQVQT